ncbi:hypothetical protein H2248_003355 [Termitomyces sp. 'cryptogamus']|nr:hypothetical protein H2248_003355 [Termitomyces sp. 'cryptogamus']
MFPIAKDPKRSLLLTLIRVVAQTDIPVERFCLHPLRLFVNITHSEVMTLASPHASFGAYANFCDHSTRDVVSYTWDKNLFRPNPGVSRLVSDDLDLSHSTGSLPGESDTSLQCG